MYPCRNAYVVRAKEVSNALDGPSTENRWCSHWGNDATMVLGSIPLVCAATWWGLAYLDRILSWCSSTLENLESRDFYVLTAGNCYSNFWRASVLAITERLRCRRRAVRLRMQGSITAWGSLMQRILLTEIVYWLCQWMDLRCSRLSTTRGISSAELFGLISDRCLDTWCKIAAPIHRV